LQPLSLERLTAAVAFVLVATLACLIPVQNDTWWHLAAGRDMAASGRVALTETWSHTAAGGHWANYEWLTQVLFFGLYRAGGLPLLTLACAAAVVGAYACAWRLMTGPDLARALLLVSALSASTIVWAVRPQVLTLCLVGVTVLLVARRRFAWLPLLFVIWANLHGAVALGGVVLVAALGAALWTERRLVRPLAVTAALCFAAGFLTPLGWRYWIEIGLSLARSRANQIIEWQPPGLPPAHLVFWIGLAALAGLAVVRRRRLGSFDIAFPVWAAGLVALLALRSQRNVPVFLLLALPAVSRLAFDPAADVRQERLEPWRSRLHWSALGIAVLGAIWFVASQWRAVPSPIGWTPMTSDAAAAIRSCPAPIYNTYNDGGFIVWFVPGQKVFLDSRQDPYPVSLVQAHVRAERTGTYEPLFARYGIRCAVFARDSESATRLKARGWRPWFADAQWTVLLPPVE
jgi:hypothetical protein